MSIFDRRSRVFVNGVEVPGSPVEPSVRVEVEEALPALPTVELAPFAVKQRCDECRCREVDWTYRSGYHDRCPTGVVAPWPYTWVYEADGKESPQYRRNVQLALQRQATVPPHHDIRCLRCKNTWVIAVAPDDDEVPS